MKNPETVATLKALGCKITERETTDGAHKWWLSVPEGMDGFGIKAALFAKVGQGRFLGHREYAMPDGCTFAITLPHEVFVALPRKSQAGRDYARGIDC